MARRATPSQAELLKSRPPVGSASSLRIRAKRLMALPGEMGTVFTKVMNDRPPASENEIIDVEGSVARAVMSTLGTLLQAHRALTGLLCREKVAVAP